MTKLYPIKFTPIIKDKIWGGDKLKSILNKPTFNTGKAGESWEICGLQGNLSVVSNGFLTGNTIEEIIEIYMGDIVGDVIYETCGLEFPLLFKFIDANDFLSIQVHPDDEIASEKHSENGKTEMWYILNAEDDAELIVGFNKPITKSEFLKSFGSGTLPEILNFEKVNKGDVYFVPAGRIHATGPGVLFAEIQQTSDLTYRIYDWDRLDDEGEARDLHVDLAVDALDYKFERNYKTDYSILANESSELVKCKYFTTNKIELNKRIEKDYNWLDSFVVYMAIEGDFKIEYNGEEMVVLKGETVLLPAVLKNIFLKPTSSKAELLEVYINNK